MAMDNEAYVAKLDIDLSLWDKRINQAKAQFDGLTEATKKKFKLDFDTKTSNVEDTGNLLREQEGFLKSLQSEWNKLDEVISSGKATTEQISRYNYLTSAIHRAEDALKSLQSEYVTSANETVNYPSKIANVFDRLKQSVEKSKSSMAGVFNHIRKSVLRLGMSIVGVRSAFAFFRKVVNTALSNNIDLTNKMNAIWQALGNAITPILERIVNFLVTALSYFNVFLKAVSGGKIDLLAKTSASAKSTAGSLKEANKYLAGFDELNNVDEQTGSGGSAGASVADPFAGIEVDTGWADKIQAFGEWVQINWPLVIGLLAGTWLAFSPLTEGFKIWDKLGIVLIIAGIAEGFKGIHDFVNGIKTGNLDLVAQGLREIALGIGLVSLGLMLLTNSMTGWYGIAIAIVLAFASYVIEHWDEIKEGFQILWDKIVEGVTQIRDWFVEKWNNISYAVSECWKSIKDNWDALKQRVSDGVQAVRDWFVEKWNNISYAWGEITKSMKDQWEGFKDKIKSGAEAIGGFFSGIWQGAKEMANNVIGYVESMINKVISGVNSLIRGINRIHFTTPDWIPLIGGKSFGFNIGQINSVVLPRLDTGTNYVPSDQLAMIHKGEAVIPKKFNSQEYFGGNSEMAEKLDVLIEAVNNIDLHPYITVKDVGQASVSYQNSQYRLRGRSLVNG